MSYAKSGVVAFLAAVALLTLSPVASATVFTSPAVTVKGESEGTVLLSGETISVSCSSASLEGSLEQFGPGITALGTVTNLSFTGCTQHIVVIANGKMELHATSGGNGTLTSTGATVTIQFTTIFGNVHCNFATNNTDIGTLTGSTTTGSTATVHMKSVSIPVEAGSNFLCGSNASLSGSFRITSPDSVDVD
jgi:hypothetical protein